MKVVLKLSLFFMSILSAVHGSVSAMEDETPKVTISPSLKWEEFVNTALGNDSPKVVGCTRNSSFLINVEQTPYSYGSIKKWGAWGIAQWHYMRGKAYSVTDIDIAEMLCVVGNYQLECVIPNYRSPFDPFSLVKLHYNESNDQANEDFSAAFKNKYPYIKEIRLIAPNFSEGVVLLKNQDPSPLEEVLKKNGIGLKYGPF